MAQALGIPVATTTEIHRKPEHPPEASFRARELLESLDEWALSAVQSVTMECKSLLIALALVLRKTTAEKVRKFLLLPVVIGFSLLTFACGRSC